MDCTAFVAQKLDPSYKREVAVIVIGNVFNISYALIPPVSTQFTTLTKVYIANNIFYKSKKQSVWGVGLLLMKLENNTFYNQDTAIVMECHLCFYTEVSTFRIMETTLYFSAPISLKTIQGVPFTVILNDVQLLNNSFRNYDFSMFF